MYINHTFILPFKDILLLSQVVTNTLPTPVTNSYPVGHQIQNTRLSVQPKSTRRETAISRSGDTFQLILAFVQASSAPFLYQHFRT